VPEHIQNLRDCIGTSHRDGQTVRHLNSSTFWQKQYDDLYRVIEKERDARFILQKENDALQAQVTKLLAQSKPGRKRKSAEQEEPETIKKMKAGTVAIAEFGPAVDVDPGHCLSCDIPDSALTACSYQGHAPYSPCGDTLQRPHVEH